jgi:fumarylacetoacetate (FAA) hydrolase
MKLATLRNGRRDGRLVVVSRDLQRAADATAIAATMQDALDDWDDKSPALETLYRRLNDGAVDGAFPFDPATAMAPLPRAHQFIDASAFLNHGRIMKQAYNLSMDISTEVPILVQRQSDDFLGAKDDYPFPAEADQGDFEGEVGVIVGDVPMGSTAAEAQRSIRLLVLFNDMSMRAHVYRELQLGFGFVRAKPATAFGPVAVTPDELGDAWRDGRVHLDLHLQRNGELVGHPNGAHMDFGFGELLAYAAYNRNLRAGMLLGSGTFSNPDHRTVGSACLAEQRALEHIDSGAARSPWLHFGERLRLEMFDAQGQSVFGAIDHRMVATPSSSSR